MLSVLLLKSLGLKRNGFTANIPTLVQTIIILNPPFTIFSNQTTTPLNQARISGATKCFTPPIPPLKMAIGP